MNFVFSTLYFVSCQSSVVNLEILTTDNGQLTKNEVQSTKH